MKRNATSFNRITVPLPEERALDSSSWVELFFEVRYSMAGGGVAIIKTFLLEARAWLGHDRWTRVPLGDDRWESEAESRFEMWLKHNTEHVEALCRADYERECEVRREEGLP